MKKFLFLIISLVNAAVTAIYIAVSPNDTIPTHYGASGEADIFSPKWSIMFLPCILIVFGIGYLIYGIFTEKSSTAAKNKKYTQRIVMGIFLMLLIMFWILQIVTLNGITNIGDGEDYIPAVISLVLGASMIFISNLLAKLEQNATIGIKTPATLSSETVWKKTHRLGGYLGVIGGVTMLACGIAGLFAKEISTVLMVAGAGIYLVTGCIIPAVYAQIIYNKEKKMNVSRD